MSIQPVPKRVHPVKEPKRYEIEVYVAYNANGGVPFISGNIVGDQHAYVPSGDVIERYVFEVERPEIVNSYKLKGQL